MRLCAETPEERAVPGDDVVGVEPSNPDAFARPTSVVCPKTRTPFERIQRFRPGRGRIAVRVVEVEVRVAALLLEAQDVLGRPRRSPCAVWLEVDGDAQAGWPRPRRRPASRSCSGEPKPHQETTKVSTPAAAISRICAGDDLRVRRRVEAAGRKVRRREHWRAVVLDVPVRPPPVSHRGRVPRVVEDRDAARARRDGSRSRLRREPTKPRRRTPQLQERRDVLRSRRAGLYRAAQSRRD